MAQERPTWNGNGHAAYLAKSPGVRSGAERDALIRKYAPLVRQTAMRVSMRLPSSVNLDELISAGCLGLIDAVDKFDPTKETRFKTYAQFRIRGAILDELRSMDWYSRSMRKKIQDVDRAVASVEARTQQPATEDEVAGELGLPIGEYQSLLSDIHGAALLNLDAFIRDEDGDGSAARRTFTEQLKSPEDPEADVERRQMVALVEEAIKKLTEKEQVVLSLYYFEELTLREIGEVMERTESRICQIHSAAMTKLRGRMKRRCAG